MKDRYLLDIRTGCGAVIDTHHPAYDSSYPGLHSIPTVLFYINKDSLLKAAGK